MWSKKRYGFHDHRTNQRLSPHRVGQIVERVGQKAGVKVGTRLTKRDKTTGKPQEVAVFAGCHSLRRGFGSKWARRVAPSVLKRLMRHASIATTEAYYVHLDAADVGNELWEKWGAVSPATAAGLQHSSNTPPVESMAR